MNPSPPERTNLSFNTIISSTLLFGKPEYRVHASILSVTLSLHCIFFIHRVTDICQQVKTGAMVTNPFTAAIKALKTTGASPIALVTPYRAEINMQMKEHFEEEGIKVNAIISFNEDNDNKVGRISSDSIEKAALEIGQRTDVNGVFLSCTNLRFAKRVEALEKKLGKPVTSSNHALAWHILTLLGTGIPNAGWGSLFDHMPDATQQD